MEISMKEKIKALLTDSMWSIAGLMLMNVVVQFLVYPVWNNHLGSEEYGNILYLISIMNIIAISVGRERDKGYMEYQLQYYSYGILCNRDSGNAHHCKVLRRSDDSD